MNENFILFLKNYWYIFFILLIYSYVMGSINISIIISKILKHDIRTLGSKNAGFSNTLRTFGVLPAILTFIVDFLKGILAVGVGKIMLNKITNDTGIIITCIHFFIFSCLLGHLYPCFFGFKGGKGILTSWASTLILDWKIFLIMITIFLIIVSISKIVSLGSIVVGFLYPLVTFIIYHNQKNILVFVTFLSSIIGFFILIKHYPNIKRLILHKEKKIIFKK